MSRPVPVSKGLALSRRVSFEALAELSFAALRNSRRLLDDAWALSSLNRAPSAFILSCFAAEEWGKHILLISFPARDLDDDAEWNNLWRRFKNHGEKLGNALLQAWWDDHFDLGDPASSSAIHLARLRSTYVDLAENNNTILEPHEAVGRVELDRMLQRLNHSIERSEKLFGATSRQRLAETMRRVSESEESRTLRDAAQADLVSLAVRAAIYQARFVADEFGEDPDEAEHRLQAAWAAVTELIADEGSG